ncbi:MAG: hypothetical protein NTZ17_07365 [Phycisphaerae bacterium]|nr:hypothetical protein [Phycisphaerae bacterium]
MKMRAAVCVASVMLLVSSALGAAPEPPSWEQTQRDVVAVLLGGKTDLADLVKQVSAGRPGAAREAMFKLIVLLRAGVDREAVGAVDELKDQCPGLGYEEIRTIYYEAGDQFGAWEVARRLVEVYASEVFDLDIENRLLKHFEETGWSVDRIDRWLANMPPGREGFWVMQRVRFDNLHGRAEPVIRALQEQIERRPEDVETALVLVKALIYARYGDRDRWDLSWMAETVRPRLATQAASLGVNLRQLQAWPAAVAFYQRSIDLPLTEAEVTEMEGLRQVYVAPDELRAFFAVQVREEMAECLLALARNSEAQKWMVEAADIRAQHQLGLNATLAGRVQNASGQAVIEGRIHQEQAAKEDDPKYWQERAGYYRGRNEPGAEEEALQKALALTAPQPPPERPSKGYQDLRRGILSDYAHFLERTSRVPEAVALLRRELEQASPDAVSTEGAAYLLVFDFPTYPNAKDEILWTWLAGRPKWGYTEERLLWRMLENSPRDALDGFFTRAEGLTRGMDASRAFTLGWIMNRMGFARRSIPLLEYAALHTLDAEPRARVTFTLFESCLDIGDWKRGEALLPETTEMTPTEKYSRLAVVAARAGAKADVLRLWRMATCTDLTQRAALPDLMRAGLRRDLTDFYTEMAKKIPSSEVPGQALKLLQAQGNN